jgi:uncharacterized protein
VGGYTDDALHAEATLEEIPREECLALLATEEVGRLAVNWATGPLVVPVNFVLDGETIVFRSGPGTKLRALAGRPVGFQVDHFDGARRVGWSVLARGRAREVSARQYEGLPVDPWVPDDKAHWVAIKILELSGRRIGARA